MAIVVGRGFYGEKIDAKRPSNLLSRFDVVENVTLVIRNVIPRHYLEFIRCFCHMTRNVRVWNCMILSS
jgi:hypothetical protein